MNCQEKESKALSNSMCISRPGIFLDLVNAIRSYMNNVFSPIYLLFINPNCVSDIKLSKVNLTQGIIQLDIIL